MLPLNRIAAVSLLGSVLCPGPVISPSQADVYRRTVRKVHAASRPVITSLDPKDYEYTIPHAASGSYPATVEIKISGRGFKQGAKARWNGKPVPTTYASATALTAQVPFALVKAVSTGPRKKDKVRLTVANPRGRASTPATFTVETIPIG